MEIVIKTILRHIITQCTRTQDIIKKLASFDPCGRKSGLKTVAFLKFPSGKEGGNSLPYFVGDKKNEQRVQRTERERY